MEGNRQVRLRRRRLLVRRGLTGVFVGTRSPGVLGRGQGVSGIIGAICGEVRIRGFGGGKISMDQADVGAQHGCCAPFTLEVIQERL